MVLRLVLATAVVLALPASAEAHAIVTIEGPTIVYSAPDATSSSTVTVAVGDTKVRITDRTIDGGISSGSCDPGAVDGSGAIIEVTCARDAASRLRVDVGPRDDTVELSEAAGAPPLPSVLIGGTGADRLTGGGAADQIDGGPGQDRLEGGAGDDELRARDGAVDVVGCGAGTDRAFLDDAELADASCESLERTDPPPLATAAPSPGPAAADTTPPAVSGGASTRQRLGRRVALRVSAGADEPAQVSATAVVRAGKRRFTLIAPQRRAGGADQQVGLMLRASSTTARALRRAARGRRPLYAVITISATDDAGNSAARRLPRIRVLP